MIGTSRVGRVVASGLLVASVGCSRPPTQVSVVTTSDVPAERSTAFFVTSALGDNSIAAMRAMRQGARIERVESPRWPATWAVVPRAGQPRSGIVTFLATYELRASGGQPATVIERLHRVQLVESVPQQATMHLAAQCGAIVEGCTSVAASDCTQSQRCLDLGATCGDSGQCVALDLAMRPVSDAGSATLDSSTPVGMDAARDGSSGCAAGTFDCGLDPRNGCETVESVANCGRCGVECTQTNATARCGGGQCVIGACFAGFDNCDGDASNGCETRTSDSAAHCGRCGMACTAGTVCVAGMCVSDCPAGQTRCGDQCVNTTTDVDHCGRCGNACPTLLNAVRGCMVGRCDPVRCASGYNNCDNNMSNGCESLGTAANCGACGTVCSGATSVCAFDRDMMSWSCVGESACTAPNQRCGDSCVETNSSRLHCGGCNMPCSFANGTGSCVTSSCIVAACHTGFANCDGNGRNGCEARLDTVTNCGMCGRSCMGANVASATCASGACRLTCSPGFADCDGNPANGCEVDLSSAQHCGACNRACGVSANAVGGTCTDGACRLSCRPDFANCDGEPANGCEVDLSSEDNCGFCGNSCALGAACPVGARTCSRAAPVSTAPFVCRCPAE